jgi:hypothetical protein
MNNTEDSRYSRGFQDSNDSRDRLIRVEENLKHIDKTLQEIKEALERQNNKHDGELRTAVDRISVLERKVDKIYWTWGAAVFVGAPIMTWLTKFLLHLLST